MKARVISFAAPAANPRDVWEELVAEALFTDSESLVERIADRVAARLAQPQKPRNPVASLSFEQAAALYLEKRAPHVAANTLRIDHERLVPLGREFNRVPLHTITAARITQYQRKRLQQGISGRTINLETNLIKRVMEPAGLWSAIGPEIQRFKETSNVGRAITPEQKRKLFEVGWKRPRWRFTICAAALAAATTARSGEIQALRWQDVDFEAGLIHFPKSKTAAGIRTVPINADALYVLRWLHRAAAKFGRKPEHFVIPGYLNRRLDATKQRSRFASTNGWRAITKAAGVPGLRFHDLRHLAVTELLESGVPDAVVMELAGHVSKQMLSRYSHPRIQSKKAAVEKLQHGLLRPSGVPRNGSLTKRHTEIAQLIAQGLERPAIAERLGITESGLRAHLWRMGQALNLPTWEDLCEKFRSSQA